MCVRVHLCVSVHQGGQVAGDVPSQEASLLPPGCVTVHALASIVSPKTFDWEEEESLALSVP